MDKELGDVFPTFARGLGERVRKVMGKILQEIVDSGQVTKRLTVCKVDEKSGTLYVTNDPIRGDRGWFDG